ncbi:MAG: ATP-binding cassette domain-containing protein [Clostridia bacterium]|jgi:energy-coupling factor transport system ATP-binding protein|nr:ATP-binding cassette domain-containing protein [Clostridia bacterium]
MVNREPVIEIKNLTFTYPNNFTALKNINTTIYNGEFVGIIGQNGAGKSTLLKNITGLLKPTKGDIIIDGVNTKEITVARLSTKIGFVLQNPDRQLFAETVEKEVAFGPRNLKLSEDEIQARVKESLAYVGLEHIRDKFPPALSKGDRAKVIIASVLAMKPRLIILDEPTTGQDYRGCHQIMGIAKEFNKAGHTVLVVTHHMALVADYAERTIVFCEGEILLDGSTREVFAQPQTLKKSFIIPPQITMVGSSLEKELGLQEICLTVSELGDTVLNSSKNMA